MPANRNKRLRQYKKVRDYCHKRIVGHYPKTRHQMELLMLVCNRAVVAVFNGCTVKPRSINFFKMGPVRFEGEMTTIIS
jgi:hypothetical protein